MRKRISPRTANGRAHSLTAKPHAYIPRKLRPAAAENKAVAVLAEHLILFKSDFGRWPNAAVRGWAKDRKFKRAMRRAKAAMRPTP